MTINVLCNEEFNSLIKTHAKSCNGKYIALPTSDRIGVRCSCGVDLVNSADCNKFSPETFTTMRFSSYKEHLEYCYIGYNKYRKLTLSQRLMEKL